MSALFALTLFISSALLFLAQPMVAKMLLPSLGSAPGVWNTCMVFFQAGLLVGYAYAHAAPRWLRWRTQVVLHLTLAVLPFLALPIGPPAGAEPPVGGQPVLWLLEMLLVSVGLPYVVVATCAPLLQKWFTSTENAASKDPYFLYAASNFGSLLALILYPILMEPNLTLAAQRSLWAGGYSLLAVLIFLCGAFVWLAQRARGTLPETSGTAPAPSALPTITWIRRLRWLGLSAVPSSLMLSVTTHLTADIASIPLLWVLPMGVYLLTFTLVFARRTLLPHTLMVRWMPLAVLMLVLIVLSEATEPAGLIIVLNLTGLFWICMACHGELARTRPPAEQLTEFYLGLAVGGVLGGLLSALVAPVVFRSVFEYPLALVLSCLLQPDPTALLPRKSFPPVSARALQTRARWDLLLSCLVGLLTAGLVEAGQALELPPGPKSVANMFAVPIVVCYLFKERPVRFGLSLGAILAASTLYAGAHGRAQYQVRSFFGVHRVTIDAAGGYRRLIHGNTVHGAQSLDPERRDEPLTYFHRKGPIGQLFAAMDGDPRLSRVAIAGLGAGSLSSYAKPGDHWTYFEIDPVVAQIAEDEAQFTYLHDARSRLAKSGGKIDIVLGDARLTLKRSRDTFGLIIIDAFSSDAIPVHLLTREALQLYRSKLTANGILALNISNRFLDLKQVVAALARDSSPPMACWVEEDRDTSHLHPGQSPSIWAVLASTRSDVEKLLQDRDTGGRWESALPRTSARVWTDDFSNVFEVIRWR